MCLYCYETKHTNTTRELRAALNLSCLFSHTCSRSLPSQDADAECRMQNRPQSCELRPMQDADAECRMQNQPQSCELHPMQDADAECRMQKRAQSYSCERRAGCRMQNAECKNSPTARRERTEYRCRMQVQNAKTRPIIGTRVRL